MPSTTETAAGAVRDATAGTVAPRAGVVASAATASDDIRVRTALARTPDRAGNVSVTQRFELPDRVTELRVRLSTRAWDVRAEGFTHEGDGVWSWDGETVSPTLRYRLRVNETARETGPLGGEGAYLFVDPGLWALVRTPAVGLSWRYRGDPVEVDRRTVVDGEGVANGDLAFLGPHRVVERAAGDQTFRLVVPAAADLEATPSTILEVLATASNGLRVGDRDETVLVVAAPTATVEWGVQGLAVGYSAFWARDAAPVDSVSNVWVHEYVHTRQAFRTEPSARWVTEATATWYAAYYTLRSGRVDFDRFRSFLRRGTRQPQADAVLARPSTWANHAQYLKGALVAGELDRRIRLATDMGASLQTVLRTLNAHGDPVTNADVVAAVGDAGGEGPREAAERFTTTEAVPDVWDAAAHADAFGTVPAKMRVAVDLSADVRLRGPYREGDLDRRRVAVGERIAVRVAVENVGGSAGRYEVALRVDGRRVAGAAGDLQPGEATTVVLTYRFQSTGERTLSVAGERLVLRVREPADPTVTSVAVGSRRVAPGGAVEVRATVANRAPVPGNATVQFTRDGEVVATREVTVLPGEQRVVTASVPVDEPGTHRVGAGGRTVRIEAATPEATATALPGFGVATALSGLAVLALIARLGGPRRRS